jgi:hypothetical protein
MSESSAGTVIRNAITVVVGVIVWMVGFLALARVLVLLWPAYAVHARLWTRTGAYDFTPLMSVFNACLWIIAEIIAGWLAAVMARRRGPVWALAVIVMGYLCCEHFYLVWHQLPWWYNFIVALSSGPAVLLGGRLGARSDRPVTTASTQVSPSRTH